MGKDDTIVNNFVTRTKRLPLKARFVVALSLVVVVFELVSGMMQMNSEVIANTNIAQQSGKKNLEVGKVRERKDINLEQIAQKISKKTVIVLKKTEKLKEAVDDFSNHSDRLEEKNKISFNKNDTLIREEKKNASVSVTIR